MLNNKEMEKLSKSEFLKAIADQERKVDISVTKNFDFTRICSIYDSNRKSSHVSSLMVKVIREFSEKIFEFIDFYFVKS